MGFRVFCRKYVLYSKPKNASIRMIQKIKNKLVQLVRRSVLGGDNNYCPICGFHAYTFLPYGVKKRPNAQCPNCQSLERQRLIWLYMEEYKLLEGNKTLLHISPEKMLFRKFSKNSALNYVPADKFDPGYSYPAGTVNMDITEIAYPDNHFDAVICSHVLEHVPEDRKAMRELNRVLKPGGWAIMLVPIDKSRDQTYEDFSITTPEARLKAFWQEDHVRLYGNDFGDRLQESGFDVKKENFAHHFSPEDRFRLGLLTEEDIYFCVKPMS